MGRPWHLAQSVSVWIRLARYIELSRSHTLTRNLPILAYLGLFLWSFLAATVLPIGSEVALIAIVQAEKQICAPVVIATAGNYLGACTTYWIGRRAAEALGGAVETGAPQSPSARLLRRFGQPVMLLSWMPVLGDLLVAVAGGLRMPFAPFSFWVILGKAARYAALGWAVRAL